MNAVLQGHIKNGVVVFDGPMSLPDGTAVRVEAVESVEQRFQRLKAEWHADTKYLSNPNKIKSHPAFRAIIAMGMEIVPFMMRDLADGPALWVWALPEITGENPVPDGYDGNVRKHSEIWLQWGREEARMSDSLPTLFPGLAQTAFWYTSPFDDSYNCIAWAAGSNQVWWWPDGLPPRVYWPPGVPREETLDAFAAALSTVGYTVGSDESLEPDYEKVALFADAAGLPTHAARQLPSGL